MLLLGLLLGLAGLLGCSRGLPAGADQCALLQRFLAEHNATATLPAHAAALHPPNTICGGRCCDADMEQQLRQQAKQDFHSQIHHHSRSLLGLLATTAEALRETVGTLARQSENKTLTLFKQVYRGMGSQGSASISRLYGAMVEYVSAGNSGPGLDAPLLAQHELHSRFAEFFARLFPLAYRQALEPLPNHHNHHLGEHHHQLGERGDFTEEFKACLTGPAMQQIEPFGSIPKQIGQSVGKSLEGTRVLIQALSLGRSVLDKTDGLLMSLGGDRHQCYNALLKMTHCPKCKPQARAAQPCRGFCTNVMRGCLTEPASELDFAWSEYVETLERLVVAVDGHNDPLGLNVEKAMRQLDSRISDAVMHAMEKGPSLEEKVRAVCGRAEFVTSGGGGEPVVVVSAATAAAAAAAASPTRSSGAGPGPGAPSPLLTRAMLGATVHHHPAGPAPPNHQLHAQLGNFLASVVSSRSFYATLADTICEDYPERQCWNGERVAEYAKTVVDSSLISQRYNPEFTLSTTDTDGGNKGYANANTSVLIDQLRHINQVVQAQLMSAPDSGVLLADEGIEGSGSGDRGLWAGRPGAGPDDPDTDDEDADDDRDDAEASGSGMGPSDIGRIEPKPEQPESKDAGPGLRSGWCLVPIALLLLQLASRRLSDL